MERQLFQGQQMENSKMILKIEMGTNNILKPKTIIAVWNNCYTTLPSVGFGVMWNTIAAKDDSIWKQVQHNKQ